MVYGRRYLDSDKVFTLKTPGGYLVRTRNRLHGRDRCYFYVTPDYAIYRLYGPIDYQLKKLTGNDGFEKGFEWMLLVHDLVDADSSAKMSVWKVLTKYRADLALLQPRREEF